MIVGILRAIVESNPNGACPPYGAGAVICHVINETKGRNGDDSWPTMALGLVTVAIVGTIMWTAGKQMRAERMKEQGRAAEAAKGGGR